MRIHDLLDPGCIDLQAAPADKAEAVNHLVDLAAKSGCLSDVVLFRDDVFAREAQSSTGFGEGVAMPHAKSNGVLRPGLAAMVVPDGVDFDAVDGRPVRLFFLIASPHQASDAHLDVLARLSTLMIDEEFRKKLLTCRDPAEFIACIDAAESAALSAQEQKDQEQQETSSPKSGSNPQSGSRPIYDIVAVTACPAGLSHTYMAAEALEHKAREMGLRIKVEADGAAGNRNRLLPEDIANARAVIVAADRAVEMDRFIGKPMVRSGVGEGVHSPGKLIEKALSGDCPVYTAGTSLETSSFLMRLYRHLMSGLTYILPLAATAGILAAIARLEFLRGTETGLFLDSIGYSIGALLFPVLSAFISFSIAGRTALVAGFTGGVMADMSGAGVIGAVLNGFIGGGAAFVLTRIAARFLKGHDAMFALLVYPLLGATITTLAAQYVTGLPASFLDHFINDFLLDAPLWQLTLIGAVLGGMMSADMGGPCNKTAYAAGVLLLSDCLPENGSGSMVMAAVMAGGMIPPMAAALAAGIFGRSYFEAGERKLALSAFFKGLLFVTEGVLPYLACCPWRMRTACVIGSACSGAASMFFACGVCAPHGGIFIVPLAQNHLFYLLAILIGLVTGTASFVLLRRSFVHRQQARKAAAAAAEATAASQPEQTSAAGNAAETKEAPAAAE